MKSSNGRAVRSSASDDAGRSLRKDPEDDGNAQRTTSWSAWSVSVERGSRILSAIVVLAAAAFFFRRSLRVRKLKRGRPNEAEAAIARGNAAYLDALKRGDAPAYASLFTHDAVSMPASGTMLRGRDAIEASIEHAFARVRFCDGSLDTTDTRVEGATAYESGTYAFDVLSDGVPTTLAGRYLVVWRKAGDEWKIALDSSHPAVEA